MINLMQSWMLAQFFDVIMDVGSFILHKLKALDAFDMIIFFSIVVLICLFCFLIILFCVLMQK